MSQNVASWSVPGSVAHWASRFEIQRRLGLVVALLTSMLALVLFDSPSVNATVGEAGFTTTTVPLMRTTGISIERLPTADCGLAFSSSRALRTFRSERFTDDSTCVPMAASELFATNSADDLAAQARAARDARAADELAKATGKNKPPAAVTGGYDPKTGRVAAGCSSNPVGCAEDDVARQLGVPKDQVQYVEAVRPRTGAEVPICHTCQGATSPSQYPPGVKAKPGGPWGR